MKVSEFVFPNVTVVEPDLSFLNAAKGFPDLGIALTNRLYFRAEEDNPGLKAIAHEVIVRGFGVANFPITGIAGLFFSRHGERSLGEAKQDKLRIASTRPAGLEIPASQRVE